jgi:hypothetical protein
MKLIILYQPNSELESSVTEYVRSFAQETGRTIDLIDSDSVEGVEAAKLYDILQFPAIVVFKDDGSIVQSWVERDKWPTASELSYYN